MVHLLQVCGFWSEFIIRGDMLAPDNWGLGSQCPGGRGKRIAARCKGTFRAASNMRRCYSLSNTWDVANVDVLFKLHRSIGPDRGP